MNNAVKAMLCELNLTDRFLFAETMDEPEAYKATVGILLENEIELLDHTQTEKELRVSPELRAVRLDVVSMDRDGLYRYTFVGQCKEVPGLALQDGVTRVFINTYGTNRQDFSREFLDFMDYINDTRDAVAGRSRSARVKLVRDKVEKIRRSEKCGVRYMQRWEEIAYARQEGHSEGLEEGRREGALREIAAVCKKLAKGKSVEQIADELEQELESISQICHIAEKYAPAYDYEAIYHELS